MQSGKFIATNLRVDKSGQTCSNASDTIFWFLNFWLNPDSINSFGILFGCSSKRVCLFFIDEFLFSIHISAWYQNTCFLIFYDELQKISMNYSVKNEEKQTKDQIRGAGTASSTRLAAILVVTSASSPSSVSVAGIAITIARTTSWTSRTRTMSSISVSHWSLHR